MPGSSLHPRSCPNCSHTALPQQLLAPSTCLTAGRKAATPSQRQQTFDLAPTDRSAADIQAFQFDTPSPDDIVQAAQGRPTGQLRTPAAAPGKADAASSKTQSAKPPAPAVNDAQAAARGAVAALRHHACLLHYIRQHLATAWAVGPYAACMNAPLTSLSVSGCHCGRQAPARPPPSRATDSCSTAPGHMANLPGCQPHGRCPEAACIRQTS